MKVFEGSSVQKDAIQAVAETTADWPNEQGALDFILVFCSTEQDLSEVGNEFSSRFGDVPIAGCTTSGEHLAGSHANGSLVAIGVQSPQVRWSTAWIDDLAAFNSDRALAAGDELFEKLGVSRDEVDTTKCFSLLLIDGLSMAEERVASLLADSIEGIPLVGGSAGDDLKFERTQVLAPGQVGENAAVVVMGIAEQPFKIIKHQHFTTKPQSVVVTKADPKARRVQEMDGIVAVEAYARALGVTREELTDELTFSNPVTLSCNNEIYVRSIQKVEDDGSLVFYCAVEEGMVLDIGGHHPMVPALREDLSSLGPQGAELVIGCNCVLRALEASAGKEHETLGGILKDVAEHSIGFDTYGEQLNGLHINQTLVALAFLKEAG